jgi:hypothetical protein
MRFLLLVSLPSAINAVVEDPMNFLLDDMHSDLATFAIDEDPFHLLLDDQPLDDQKISDDMFSDPFHLLPDDQPLDDQISDDLFSDPFHLLPDDQPLDDQISDDLFSDPDAFVMLEDVDPNALPWDDTALLLPDSELPHEGLLEASDSSFITAASSVSSESEMSSCLTETFDLQASWSKVRARQDRGGSCSAVTQPPPDSLTDLPGTVWTILEHLDKAEERKLLRGKPKHRVLIKDSFDPQMCHPRFPYHLCCYMKVAGPVEIFMGVEVFTEYRYCISSMLFRFDQRCRNFGFD